MLRAIAKLEHQGYDGICPLELGERVLKQMTEYLTWEYLGS